VVVSNSIFAASTHAPLLLDPPPRAPPSSAPPLRPAANVVRGGKHFSVDASLLVPGDIVEIKSGDRLPADLRLIHITNLQARAVGGGGGGGGGVSARVSACGRRQQHRTPPHRPQHLSAPSPTQHPPTPPTHTLKPPPHTHPNTPPNQIQEAMLTGESVPISKNLLAVAETAGLGDRKCMGFSATTVSAGKGVGVVVATGDAAEIGKINKLVNQVGWGWG